MRLPRPRSVTGSDLSETPSTASSDSELENMALPSPHTPRKAQAIYLSLTVALETELQEPIAACWADSHHFPPAVRS